MVNPEVARTVVGIIGNIIALILFSSPVPTFIHIWKKGSVEQYSAAPYLATFINCGLWVLYGLPMVHPKSTLVVTINGTGLVIETVYLLLFIIFSDRKKRLNVLMIWVAEVAFLAVLSVCVLTLIHKWELRSDIVGTICIVGNVMMYAAPLSVMKMVITTRSVEYMPFTLSLASFANGIAWTAYALIRFDRNIVIPNGMGTVFGLAQLLLYATYYKSTKKQIEEKQANGELGLAEKGELKYPKNEAQNGVK